MPKYYIIRQSTGEKLRSTSLERIANYLDSTPFMIKLHLDHDVQIKGWMIKTIT